MSQPLGDRPSRPILTGVFVVASTLLAGVFRLPWAASGGLEPAVLLASVLAGSASVALISVIGARLAGMWGAAGAGLLAALSPIHTLASRGAATSEVALVLLAALSLWLVLRVDADSRWLEVVGFGLSEGALASVSAAGLGLAIFQLAWLAARPARRPSAALSTALAVAFMVLAAGLGLHHSPLSEGADVVWAPATTLAGMVRCAGASFTRVAGFEYQLVVSRALCLAPLTLVVIALALLGGLRAPARPRWLFLGAVAVPFALGALLALLTGRVTPLQAGRMIAALPALIVLAGTGLASLRGGRLVAVSVVVLGATTLFLGLVLTPGP